jgi:hypothetical protein
MPGEDSIADLRHHAVLEADDTWENGLAAAELAQQVGAQLIFHASFSIIRSLQLAEGSGSLHGFHYNRLAKNVPCKPHSGTLRPPRV